MLSAALLLFANTLLFSLRLSGGGSFPKPLSAAEEREYLRRYAQGDQEARDVLIERNLRLMLLSILVRRVEVRQGYELNIQLTPGFEQFLDGLIEMR